MYIENVSILSATTIVVGNDQYELRHSKCGCNDCPFQNKDRKNSDSICKFIEKGDNLFDMCIHAITKTAKYQSFFKVMSTMIVPIKRLTKISEQDPFEAAIANQLLGG
jgi:hypothetical protein